VSFQPFAFENHPSCEPGAIRPKSDQRARNQNHYVSGHLLLPGGGGRRIGQTNIAQHQRDVLQHLSGILDARVAKGLCLELLRLLGCKLQDVFYLLHHATASRPRRSAITYLFGVVFKQERALRDALSGQLAESLFDLNTNRPPLF
jgi:hypothetical protein